jgi:hypothetical protein
LFVNLKTGKFSHEDMGGMLGKEFHDIFRVRDHGVIDDILHLDPGRQRFMKLLAAHFVAGDVEGIEDVQGRGGFSTRM